MDRHRQTSPDNQGEVSRPPHPRSLLLGLQAGSGQLREKTGQEALASVQARYCCCRLVGCPHAPRCLWLLALRGPPSKALVVLCALHHRRISETGKEVAGIHGLVLLLGGGGTVDMGPMFKPEADRSQAGGQPILLFLLPSGTCRTTLGRYPGIYVHYILDLTRVTDLVLAHSISNI